MLYQHQVSLRHLCFSHLFYTWSARPILLRNSLIQILQLLYIAGLYRVRTCEDSDMITDSSHQYLRRNTIRSMDYRSGKLLYWCTRIYVGRLISNAHSEIFCQWSKVAMRAQCVLVATTFLHSGAKFHSFLYFTSYFRLFKYMVSFSIYFTVCITYQPPLELNMPQKRDAVGQSSR
jgi:hypothetical protein